MNNVSKNRILREFEDFSKNAETSNLSVSILSDDIYHWKGVLTGPEDTMYSGGRFQIDIQIPSDYPYKPPKMKFDTKIWHPNISSQTGAICLDILKNEWSPALGIRTALLSLQALMCAPEPSKHVMPLRRRIMGGFIGEFRGNLFFGFMFIIVADPQDAVVAK